MGNKNRQVLLVVGVFALIAGLILLARPILAEDIIDELKAKIAEREASIKALEAEITAAQADIDKNRSKQKTLANTIKTYDAERKKLLAQIQVTTDKIAQKEMEIDSLSFSISDKARTISDSRSALAGLVRERDSLEGQNTFTVLLNDFTLSRYWDTLWQSQVLSESIGKELELLKVAKAGLEGDKAEAEDKKHDLSNLQKQLSGQKQVAEAELRDRQQLLKITKNQESEYQKILKQKLAAKEAFEKELLDFESQLNFAIDPNSIPAASSGVLHWPLDLIKITQRFGNTEFAAAHTALYNGNGHNGVDFGASIGTPVKAAEAAVVKGVGDTDTACPNASYGKWILLEHLNGLSTLYAHLSVISVKPGDSVGQGDIIALSGNTGYTTGPHLHFTVYATQGVRIMSRQSKVCSGVYTMPVADLKAYLNPLSYL